MDMNRVSFEKNDGMYYDVSVESFDKSVNIRITPELVSQLSRFDLLIDDLCEVDITNHNTESLTTYLNERLIGNKG